MKKKTLALLTISALLMSLTACLGGTQTPQDESTEETTEEAVEEIPTYEPGEIPFDYPTVGTTASADDYILAPTNDSLQEAFEEGSDHVSLILYSAKMIEPGAVESVIEAIGEQYTIPNSLIIPIKPEQTAEVQDVVLTWWQSGSGVIKAIVTQAGTEPTVRYLDTYLTEEEVLKPNSFHKLSGELEPGVSVAMKGEFGYEHTMVVNVSEEKVLVSGWASKLYVIDKADVVVIPPSIEVTVGSTIMAPVIGTYEPVVVKEVNAEIGQVIAEYEWAGEMTEETFVRGEIIKEL
jgi:hypothetical protein